MLRMASEGQSWEQEEAVADCGEEEVLKFPTGANRRTQRKSISHTLKAKSAWLWDVLMMGKAVRGVKSNHTFPVGSMSAESLSMVQSRSHSLHTSNAPWLDNHVETLPGHFSLPNIFYHHHAFPLSLSGTFLLSQFTKLYPVFIVDDEHPDMKEGPRGWPRQW